MQKGVEPLPSPADWGAGVFMGGEAGLGGDPNSSPLLSGGDEQLCKLAWALLGVGCDPQSGVPSPDCPLLMLWSPVTIEAIYLLG